VFPKLGRSISYPTIIAVFSSVTYGQTAEPLAGRHCASGAAACSNTTTTGSNSITDELEQRLASGIALRTQGRYEDAQKVFSAILEQARRRDPHGAVTAEAADYLGGDEHDLGHYVEAERHFAEALSIWKKRGELDGSEATAAKTHLAELYAEEGRPREAESLLRQAADALERSAEPDPLKLVIARVDLALSYNLEHKHREAEALLRKALTGFEEHVGAHSPLLLAVLTPLAVMLSASHRYPEALALAERSWSIIEEWPQLAPPDRINTMMILGSLYALTNRPKDSESFAERAMKFVEAAYDRDNPRVGWYLLNYAFILKHLHRTEEAKTAEKHGREILAHSKAANPALHTININALR
jgi:Tfp pilus assembly protein PilF